MTVWIVDGFYYNDHLTDSMWDTLAAAETRRKFLDDADKSGRSKTHKNRTRLERYALHYSWGLTELQLNLAPEGIES